MKESQIRVQWFFGRIDRRREMLCEANITTSYDTMGQSRSERNAFHVLWFIVNQSRDLKIHNFDHHVNLLHWQ